MGKIEIRISSCLLKQYPTKFYYWEKVFYAFDGFGLGARFQLVWNSFNLVLIERGKGK